MGIELVWPQIFGEIIQIHAHVLQEILSGSTLILQFALEMFFVKLKTVALIICTKFHVSFHAPAFHRQLKYLTQLTNSINVYF